jgi:hypothetical protein
MNPRTRMMISTPNASFAGHVRREGAFEAVNEAVVGDGRRTASRAGIESGEY